MRGKDGRGCRGAGVCFWGVPAGNGTGGELEDSGVLRPRAPGSSRREDAKKKPARVSGLSWGRRVLGLRGPFLGKGDKALRKGASEGLWREKGRGGGGHPASFSGWTPEAGGPEQQGEGQGVGSPARNATEGCSCPEQPQGGALILQLSAANLWGV